jgi:hypothetical protein
MTTGSQAEEIGGSDSYADTVRIRVLPESVVQEPPPGNEPPARGFDPYSTDIGALAAPPKGRRTLDDMRRLSEAIVRNRLRAK